MGGTAGTAGAAGLGAVAEPQVVSEESAEERVLVGKRERAAAAAEVKLAALVAPAAAGGDPQWFLRRKCNRPMLWTHQTTYGGTRPACVYAPTSIDMAGCMSRDAMLL